MDVTEWPRARSPGSPTPAGKTAPTPEAPGCRCHSLTSACPAAQGDGTLAVPGGIVGGRSADRLCRLANYAIKSKEPP